MRVLFYTNILFGTFSLITVIFGFKFMNEAGDESKESDNYIICYQGNKWIENNLWGTLFLMCHQILILLQINASQFVLIRTPNSMGLFEERTLADRVGAGLRSGLLNKTLDDELKVHESHAFSRSMPEVSQDQQWSNAMATLRATIKQLRRMKTMNSDATRKTIDRI